MEYNISMIYTVQTAKLNKVSKSCTSHSKNLYFYYFMMRNIPEFIKNYNGYFCLYHYYMAIDTV